MIPVNHRTLGLLLVLGLLITHFNIYSGYLITAYCVFISLVFRRVAVYMLILIASTQDSPGLGGNWWYICFCSVATIMLVGEIYSRLLSKGTSDMSRFKFPHSGKLVYGGIFVVCYGTMVSVYYYLQNTLSQDDARPFYLLAPLMILMIVVGMVAASRLQGDARASQKVAVTIGVIVGHVYLVMILQVVVGPSFYSSDQFLANLDNYGQVINASELGFARISGTYATPNGMAFVVNLLLLFYVFSRVEYGSHSLREVFFLALLSFGVSILALSKSAAILSCIFFVVLLLNTSVGKMKWIVRFGMLVLAGFAVFLVFDSITSDSVISSFRVGGYFGGGNYRTRAWQALVSDFTAYQWLLGTGLSYWPVFFENSVGFRMADPHSWMFSYLGSFGVIGLCFFVFVIWLLYQGTVQTVNSTIKIILFTLLGVLLVKDAVTIQSLLGNSPVTFLLWTLIFLGLSSVWRFRNKV